MNKSNVFKFTIEDCATLLAYIQVVFSALGILATICLLNTQSSALVQMTKNTTDELKPLAMFISKTAIQFSYFNLLFAISELCANVFLFRALCQKNLKDIRIGLFLQMVYTSFELIFCASTLHTRAVLHGEIAGEVAVGILVKLPILAVAWRYYLQLVENKRSLVNEAQKFNNISKQLNETQKGSGSAPSEITV